MTVGYLRADTARVDHWKSQRRGASRRLKVGISRRGGLASTRRSVRSVPFEPWLPVLALPGVDFVSPGNASAATWRVGALRGSSDVIRQLVT